MHTKTSIHMTNNIFIINFIINIRIYNKYSYLIKILINN
jgi:hypothetical protein